MAFYADSLLSFRSVENKHEKQQISQSSQQKQSVKIAEIYKQPNRELSSFLLNELRANDFFQDTYVASSHCLELEYDLDELISLSKQLQQKHNTALSIRDGQRSKTEGEHKALKRNHQPVAEKCVTPKSSVLNHEPYSLVGYSVKANTRRSAKRNFTPLKCKSQKPVSTKIQFSLISGNRLFSGTEVTRPKLWSSMERPVPKKHSCIVLPVQRSAKRSVLNLNKSADYYRFEKTHPNIELVRSDTLFPKRVAKVEATPSIDLCSSEFSEEKSKESTVSKIVNIVDVKESIEVEAQVRNPTWHDVLEQKLEGAPKISETQDKEIQVEFVEEIPQKIMLGRGENRKSCCYGISRAPIAIQVLPPLNIRRECRIQKLPDVSIASGDGFMSSNSNNNAYIEVVYIKPTDVSESKNTSTDQSCKMQPEVITSEDSDSKVKSNPYLQHLEHVVAAGNDDGSEEHDETNLPSKNSNSAEGYSTSFEINSSMQDSMTSQPITDDEKASLVEHSRSQSKSQSQGVPPQADYKNSQTDGSQHAFHSKVENQSSQSTTDSQRLHSTLNTLTDTQLQLGDNESLLTKPECQGPFSPSTSNGVSMKLMKNPTTLESPDFQKKSTVHDIQSVAQLIQNEIEDDELEIEVPAHLELTPAASTVFLQIIDDIVESSPENQIPTAFHTSPTEPTYNVPTMSFGKSAIFEMVHEDWTKQPDRIQIDNDAQTSPINKKTNLQSTAVQTDPLAGENLSNDHWEADSMASVHMVFDRIRQDKIEHWQRQTAAEAADFHHERFMVPLAIETQTAEIPKPIARHQSVQYSPQSPAMPLQFHTTEINERGRLVAHSPESSSSSSEVNHYTTLPSHRQHLSPSERLMNYKQLQHRHLLFKENPKVLRTIESIRNEAAEGKTSHRRSLNSTYRSAYEEDDIEIAAQRFLNSVHKARTSKPRTRTSVDWYRTESSSTQDSSSIKFYSLDGTPSSESASQMGERYVCTNSEATSLSTIRSPTRRCLSFRSSGNEMSIDRSARNRSISGRSALNKVSLRNSARKTHLIPKIVERVTPEALKFEMTTTSSSIDSASKIKSMGKDEAGLRQNSTSSSIEKQIAEFRLTEGTYAQRVSSDQNQSTDQHISINQMDSTGYYPQSTNLQRSTELQTDLEHSTNQNRSIDRKRSTDLKSSSEYQSSFDFQSSSDQHSSADHHPITEHLHSLGSTLSRNSDADRPLDRHLSDVWANQVSTSSSLEKQMEKMRILDLDVAK